MINVTLSGMFTNSLAVLFSPRFNSNSFSTDPFEYMHISTASES